MEDRRALRRGERRRPELALIDLRKALEVVETRVTDENGDPIAGADATLLSTETPGKRLGAARSDASGRLQLLTQATSWRLAVRAEGRRSLMAGMSEIASGAPIKLTRAIAVTLKFRSLDAKDAPPKGALVTLSYVPPGVDPRRLDGAWGVEAAAVARLPADGAFTLAGDSISTSLPYPGRWSVNVMRTESPAPGFYAATSFGSPTIIDVKPDSPSQSFDVELRARATSRPTSRKSG